LTVGRSTSEFRSSSDLVAMIIDKKFKPVHDRIRNPAVRELIREIPDQTERRQAARRIIARIARTRSEMLFFVGTEGLSPANRFGIEGQIEKLRKFGKKIIALAGFDDYDKSFTRKD